MKTKLTPARTKFAKVGNDICKIGGWSHHNGAVYWTLHPLSGANPYVCFKEGQFYRYTTEENQAIEKLQMK